MKIKLKIFTPPKGQPRPRYSARSRRFYNPPSANLFKAEISQKMIKAVGNLKLKPPIKIKMIFALKNPTARPDGDNIEKAVLDALKPWFDDAQVVECSWSKTPAEFSTIVIETAWQLQRIVLPLNRGAKSPPTSSNWHLCLSIRRLECKTPIRDDELIAFYSNGRYYKAAENSAIKDADKFDRDVLGSRRFGLRVVGPLWGWD